MNILSWKTSLKLCSRWVKEALVEISVSKGTSLLASLSESLKLVWFQLEQKLLAARGSIPTQWEAVKVLPADKNKSAKWGYECVEKCFPFVSCFVLGSWELKFTKRGSGNFWAWACIMSNVWAMMENVNKPFTFLSPLQFLLFIFTLLLWFIRDFMDDI